MKKVIRRNIEKLKTGWYIWMFPVIALGIAGWFLYDYYQEQGPRIRILFDDAAGIQAERTTIRYRGVVIGTVKDVFISEDRSDVVVEALLRKDAESLANEGSKFALIAPKVNFQGVSGLQTLIEGTFIAVDPGPVGGARKNKFKAQASLGTEVPEETSVFIIETENAESLNATDAVSYRGVKVGTISKINFSNHGQTIQALIAVENRYVHLIRNNTVFWRKVGIQAKLGLFGSEVKVNSLDSILNGGLEFATPNPPAPRAKALQKFMLVGAAPKDFAKWSPSLQ